MIKPKSLKSLAGKLAGRHSPPVIPTDEQVSKAVQNTLRGAAAMKREDWPMAAKLWENVLKLSGNHPPEDVVVNLSECYRRLFHFTQADELIDKTLLHHPGSINLKVARAENASSRKDWSEAVDRWQAVLGESPTPAPEICFVRLSYALAKLGEFSKANKIIDSGLSQHPGSLSLYVAEAKMLTEKADWNAATKKWSHVLDNFQGLSPDVLAAAVQSFRMAGKVKLAKSTLNGALDLHGQSLSLQVEGAELSSSEKNWVEARNKWKAILSDHPSLRTPVELQCRFNISVLNRLVKIDNYRQEISKYKKQREGGKKNKVVIYTSYSKGYDALKLPEIINLDFDYVCFTDDKQANGFGVFDIRPFPKPMDDLARAIRYPKTHPHTLFPGYDVAVWTDTSIMLTGDISPLINKFEASPFQIGSTPHPLRKSLEEEYTAVVNLRKDDPDIMRRQIDVYAKEGFTPSSFAENGVLLFKPDSKELGAALETWWQQILKYSKRDQLSFSYALAKHHLEWFPLTKKPNNMRNHPDLVISEHKQDSFLLNELYAKLDGN